jgi:hypothetical protein
VACRNSYSLWHHLMGWTGSQPNEPKTTAVPAELRSCVSDSSSIKSKCDVRIESSGRAVSEGSHACGISGPTVILDFVCNGHVFFVCAYEDWDVPSEFSLAYIESNACVLIRTGP